MLQCGKKVNSEPDVLNLQTLKNVLASDHLGP